MVFTIRVHGREFTPANKPETFGDLKAQLSNEFAHAPSIRWQPNVNCMEIEWGYHNVEPQKGNDFSLAHCAATARPLFRRCPKFALGSHLFVP